MHYLYVLKSKNHKRNYIGISEDTNERLREHNSGRVSSTKFYRPYVLCYMETFPTKTEARKREIELKNHAQKKKLLFEQIGLI